MIFVNQFPGIDKTIFTEELRSRQLDRNLGTNVELYGLSLTS